MKFGFSTNAFRQYELEETIEILGSAGYDGIEILLDRPHLYPPDADEDDVERVLELLNDNGLTISNCNAFMLSAIERTEESKEAEYSRDTEAFHHPSFIEPAAEDRKNRIEYTKEALRTAAALGAENISLQPGGPVPNGTSREWALDAFVEGLHQVMPTAETVGVNVLVEPEPQLLIESSDQFLTLTERIDSPKLGCNFDAGHFFCVDEDPTILVSKLEAYTGHYHLEDIPADGTHVHTQLGEGGMEIEGFLETIETADYEGIVTVELYPYEETAAETAREAMAYLEDHGWA